MLDRIKALVTDEEGATMVEYALMLALIAIVCIAMVSLVGGNAKNTFKSSADAIQAPPATP